MTSPKRRSSLLPTRRTSTPRSLDVTRIRHLIFSFLFGVAVTLLYIRFTSSPRFPRAFDEDNDFTLDDDEDQGHDKPPLLFIAIGSAPGNRDLRAAARASWLSWKSSGVVYRFYTDAPPRISVADALWTNLSREAKEHNDIVQMSGIAGGYGTKERNAYGLRALWQLRHALSAAPELTHFLRVDDDAFLCLRRLLYELTAVPQHQFFWGRYWCTAQRHRADESFMLLSRDVVRFIASSQTGRLVPFDDGVTFGWNFGYLAWTLNLTIFDDAKRIDSQQGNLTSYMHAAEPSDDVAQFCDRFIYAHHVRPEVMLRTYELTNDHLLYTLPRITRPRENCPPDTQSFAPARHSHKLPNILISRPQAR